MKSQKSFKILLLSNSVVLHQYLKRSHDSVNGLANIKDTYVMLTWLYESAIPSIITVCKDSYVLYAAILTEWENDWFSVNHVMSANDVTS